jgi:plastocyanin
MRRLRCAVLPLAVMACSGEADASRGRIAESSAGTVELGLEARGYRIAPVQNAARIDGVVLARGAPADSVVPVRGDTRVCGDSASLREVRINGNALSNALVWVDGISAGKQLPDARRATLTVEQCRFDPRIIAVATGFTINVFTRDRVEHRVNFYREGGGTPVARVHTVDAGQVVPSERIAEQPGIVEARCENHPWVRGYVAVFEHPYFAVTDSNGSFTIEQLPAGTYTVKVWHEGMERPAEQRVVVGAGGTGRLEMAVALR